MARRQVRLGPQNDACEERASGDRIVARKDHAIEDSVRQVGSDFAIEILEPHDPSLSDNFEKAVGLARFAEKHGGLFGRIQLIRKQSSDGGEHFARLEINQAATIKKLLLINSNPLHDELFTASAK